MTDLILPETVRRRLDPLMLNTRVIRAGSMKGERRSARRGTSIEFADYRNYTPGDDLRKLDWNVYARLEKPYIKLLEDEEDLAVHVVLDASASMDFPRASDDGDAAAQWHKFRYGQRIAASLAYIALRSGDRLRLTALTGEGPLTFGPTRSAAQIVPMLRYLHGVSPSGRVDLNQALRDDVLRFRRGGLFVLIGDFFAPGGHIEGLNALRAAGHEVCLLQVLAPDEVNPPLSGDLRLLDVETGEPQEITLDATLREAYEANLRAWLDGIGQDCLRRGAHYVMTQTDVPFEKVILYELRRLGVVK